MKTLNSTGSLKPPVCLNNILVLHGCRNDKCTEPTKTLTGWGSYSPESAKRYGGKHFNTYTCDKYKNGECKGDGCNDNNKQ